MYLFLIIGILLAGVGVVMYLRGRAYTKKTIQQIGLEYKERIEEDIKQNKKELEDAIRQRQYEQERAREAWDNTEQLLRSEQERLAAELKRRKELDEIKYEQEKEKKQKEMDLYFFNLNQQATEAFEEKANLISSEIEYLESKLNDFKARQDAVNAAILRQKELDEKEDFYSILVSENDKEDIQVLQSMDLRLHNRDVIPKLIWDLFIRRPCQEMAKRVTGGRKISGIYKITNKKTGEAYVGKSVDIAVRFSNHCKTAVGLEGAARATLHNRLGKDGLWNYTWEILEEVDKDNLAAREAFYIDLYGTKNQLNMKEGNKNGTQ